MTNTLLELIRRARETRDPTELVAAIPYAGYLGISAVLQGEGEDAELVGRLAYSPHLIGNAGIPALHGGTIAALLESTAIFSVLLGLETVRVPKTINITVDYLRSGRPIDTFASAELTKIGRRVASVRSFAWQEDRNKPIAIANAHLLLGAAPSDAAD